MRLNGNARLTFEKRICAPGETPEQALRRVADNLASCEENEDPRDWANSFFNIMADMDFLPNSPCLVNAGRPMQQLAACFVLPVGDSIEDIFDSVKLSALIHKSGGGTGFNFGELRPSGSIVQTTGNVASGPVSFMRVFDAATQAIKQGGVRRGANMGVLPIDHPDVREFIHLKNDNATLANFNISLGVTNEFMHCLETDTPFPLKWNGEVTEYINAYELWQEIAKSAWLSGDPGVLFIDRINEHHTTPNLGTLAATNPCGEVPLLPYHTCNLGSVNVGNFVSGDSFDYERLETVVGIAVRMLDNIIEMNNYPHPKIDEETKKARKIGLGVMGWADALILLGIPYASEKARELAGELMGKVKAFADQASVGLAAERGSFPAYVGSTCERDFPDGIRNSSRTVIAPTGTLSILADCSSGIEPLFALTFTKNVMDTQITTIARSVQEYCAKAYNGEAPEGSDPVLATAHEISPEDHVKMQAAFQAHVDDSISKTINFPNSADVHDITRAYWLAWHHGCKGITIYRDGCKTFQVLNHIQPELPLIFEEEEKCRDCGSNMVHTEGCTSCPSCGASYCEV